MADQTDKQLGTGWILGIRNIKTGEVETFHGQKIDDEDTDYEPDVHIVPCHPVPESKYRTWGAHEFNRKCYCQPTTMPCTPHRLFICHRDVVN